MDNHIGATRVRRLICKNFRCFSHLELEINAPILICEDANGSGKTSFLEALYFACYLRSFRTHLPRELVHFDQESFFLKVELDESAPEGVNLHHEVQVGFSQGNRLARVNKHAVSSRKQILTHYRVISFTEDDLALVKGAPEARRDFLDITLSIEREEYRSLLKSLKQIVAQRTALLTSGRCSADVYMILSKQLLHISTAIQEMRIALLEQFNIQVNQMLADYNAQHTVDFSYKHKQVLPLDMFESLEGCKALFGSEVRMARCLWGAHLDDFSIIFNSKRSKNFASRGQQKLIALLLKITHAQHLYRKQGGALWLLDDFMTDLDDATAQHLAQRLIETNNQLIFTAPTTNSPLMQYLLGQGAHRLSLTR